MSDQSTLTITSLSLSQSFGFFTIVVSFAILLRSILPRSSTLHHFTPCFVLNSCIVFLCYPVYFLLSFILFSFWHGISRDCVLTSHAFFYQLLLCCALFLLVFVFISCSCWLFNLFFSFYNQFSSLTSLLTSVLLIYSFPHFDHLFLLCFQFLPFFSLTTFILFTYFPSSSFDHIFLFALIVCFFHSFLSPLCLKFLLVFFSVISAIFFSILYLHLSSSSYHFPPSFSILSTLVSLSFRHL